MTTEEQTGQRPSFDSFAIVELMGHVRIAGRVTEVEMFGAKLGKIDVVDKDGGIVATQYFGGSSVYRITPCTEATACAVTRDPSDAMPSVCWDAEDSWRKKHEARLLENGSLRTEIDHTFDEEPF
jgi:hypothetical protein